MIIKLYVTVNDPDGDILKRYDQVEVHRSTTGITGTYTEITTAATRPRLVPGTSLYTFYDEVGESTYWYKTRFLNSASGAQSAFSDSTLGDDSESLTHIMTVQNLKDIYLTGLDLTDDQGNPYPDIMYEFGIRAAIGWVERYLDIDVRPKDRTQAPYGPERQDYDSANWQQWGFVQVDHYPIISVAEVALYWPSSSEAIVFPSEWYSPDLMSGQVNLIPTSGSLAQAMVLGGAYLPTILSSIPFIPRALAIKYISGFAIGTLPDDIRDMIGKKACFPILNTAGDLIAGAGIANLSISMDGLSQSIGTTSSATNSGYGARLLQYSKEIKEDKATIKRYYKNVGLAMA
jgi:hypothetical protein